MKTRIQKLTTLFVFCMVLFSFSGNAFAEESKNDCSSLNAYECNSDGTKIDYNLDTVPDKLAEEKGLLDKINEWIPALGKLDDFVDNLNILSHMHYLFNEVANIAFKLNMLGTSILLFIMDFTFDFDIVNTLIDESASKIRAVSGISTDFSISGGLFGSFLQIIVLTSAVYAMFMFIFKRSILGSFESIFKTLIVITLSMLLFSNYATFLKTVNKVTTEASELILGADMGTKKADNDQADGHSVDLDKDTIRGDMKGNVWHMFVDRPYLYMMFGSTSFTEGGLRTRFEELTRHKAGSEPRMEALKLEAMHKGDTGYGNPAILHSNVTQRLAFTPVYLSLNAFVSIPILILVVSIIIFQFWFLIMALFAPFALIVAAIPGQFNVLKRYGIELMYPLLLKLGVSFMLLMLFFVSDIIFTIDTSLADTTIMARLIDANPLSLYVLMSLLNILLFGMFFILRKRLQDILTSGSELVQDFKENQGNPFSQAFKSGVQTTAMVGGAVAGAAVGGGAAGAAMGANLGATGGKLVTGEAGVQDVAQSAIQAQRTHEFAQLRKGSEAEQLKREEEEEDQKQKQQVVTQNVEQSKTEPMANLNNTDVKSIYNNLSEDETQEIREAGREYEELQNMKQQPISEMNDSDYAKLQNESKFEAEGDKAKEIPLGKKSFDQMDKQEQYRTLKDNGVFGRSATHSTESEREPINIDDLKYKDLVDSKIESFNQSEVDQIADRLPQDKKDQFIDNMNTASLDDIKGKTVQELTATLDED